MANNVIETVILEDGPRNAVIKITGTLVESDYSGTVVTMSQFTGNENVSSGSLVGFRLNHAEFET